MARLIRQRIGRKRRRPADVQRRTPALRTFVMGDTDKHEELARLRKELEDLEVVVRQDPPLHAHTMAIARAKIAKLRQRIKELEH
jgi:transposase